MSNLWRGDRAAAAAAVGSFVLSGAAVAPAFTPWGSDAGEAAPPAPAPELDREAIEAEAFAVGFDEGRRIAEEEFAAERDALARLASGLGALRPEPSNALGLLLAETVERLVRQIVGEVAIDPALLLARAEAAAALVADETAPSKLRVHPADVPLLDRGRLPVAVVADGGLARGTLLLETASGWIEDGPEVRLERLRAELAKLPAQVVPADPRGGDVAESPVHLACAAIAARLCPEAAPDTLRSSAA